MKYVKKKINKVRLTITLSIVFAVLLALSIVLGVTLINGDTASTETDPPEIMDGESLYYNMPIAYPAIEETDIQMISVKNQNGSFELIRPDENGDMMMYYTDENGETQVYYPSILDEENIDYRELYAIEMNDSYKSISSLPTFV